MSFFDSITRILMELARSAAVSGVFTTIAKHAIRAGTAELVRQINRRTSLRKSQITVR